MSPGPVHVVVPHDIDDGAAPSGGNVYDRRLCLGLPATGWAVREHPVAGAWPRPDGAAVGSLARMLAGLPDHSAVLVDGLVACGVPEVLVPAADRLRLVVLVHLPLGDEAGAVPELAARERDVLRAAAAVMTTSPWAVRRLVAAHGLGGDRVHVATPGVDPAPLAPGTDGASRLLCVGSVTATKGQDLLVDALEAAVGLPWSCELVGPLDRDPGFASDVRRAIARHRLDGRVRLTGPRAGGHLERSYAAADLLVLPSRTESYGMVVTEALARGVPVLAMDTGGVARTLGQAPDGRLPGMLVPPGDVPALAGALRRWIREPTLRDRARRAARARRGALVGWETTARRVAAVLDGVSGAPCTRRRPSDGS